MRLSTAPFGAFSVLSALGSPPTKTVESHRDDSISRVGRVRAEQRKKASTVFACRRHHCIVKRPERGGRLDILER